jgi:hypothetical protein
MGRPGVLSVSFLGGGMKTQLRPTFAIEVLQHHDDVMARIRERVKLPSCRARVLSAGSCVEFYVEDVEKRLWSPYLSVQAQPQSDRTVLHGRFSPRPEVWTLVMFLYSLNAFLAVLGAMFGYGQWAIDRTPWAWIFVPVGLLLIVSIHVASVVGQRWSEDQMQQLRSCLDIALGAAPPRDSAFSDSGLQVQGSTESWLSHVPKRRS